MQAVLYVGHGSRIKEGIQEAKWFIENSKSIIDVPIQEICFLELASPGIEAGIAKCVSRGATKVAVVPILLLTATHAKKDIPLKMEAGRTDYPHVAFTYGNPFGIHPKIIDGLYDRVVEQNVAIAEDAHVLLVGRGSSDPEVKRDLTTIAQLLEEKYAFKKVDVCFLYGARPGFNEALLNLQQVAYKQVFIIPYLLFTGILMNDIEKKMAQQPSTGPQLVPCQNLGYHKSIQEVLVERVNELLGRMDMDGKP